MSANLISSQAAKLINDANRLRAKADKLEGKANSLLMPSECHRASHRMNERKGPVAIFLGAGASKSFGWPLTNELLPNILDGLNDENLFEDDRVNTKRNNADDRKLLRQVLSALCPGLNLTSPRSRPLPLITSLLSMLDYSLSTNQSVVSGLTPERSRHARSLFERAIYEVIEHEDEEYPPRSRYWPSRQPNQAARRLIEWLDRLRKNPSHVGVITANYDLAIEKSWGFDEDDADKMAALALDFGFSWLWACGEERTMVRPTTPKRRLYKLHGSTNWVKCGLCDRVYINPEVDIAIFGFARNADARNECHCGHAKLEVQIVSPSFVREVRAPNLIAVWQNALGWLRDAEDWVIVGYSFPDEDLNIRSLFARALAARKKSPHITIVQHGTNEQTRARYEAFFPADRLTYLTGGLKTFLKNVEFAV